MANVGIKSNSQNVDITFSHIRFVLPYLTNTITVNTVGIPKVQWRGIADFDATPLRGMKGLFNVLVMDLLGPSLEELFQQCGRRFQLKTVLMIADQALSLLEYIHDKCLVHRDLKPANFLIGLGENQSAIFLIDFGLAKPYCHPKTSQHVCLGNKTSAVGTTKFKSSNALSGSKESRRDDLESFGYILMYFLGCSLPCHGMITMSPEQLCKGHPPEFLSYIVYCRSLLFEEHPDYNYLKHLFKELYKREGFCYDAIFDWSI
jgi:serine/threonine protein kinase